MILYRKKEAHTCKFRRAPEIHVFYFCLLHQRLCYYITYRHQKTRLYSLRQDRTSSQELLIPCEQLAHVAFLCGTSSFIAEAVAK